MHYTLHMHTFICSELRPDLATARLEVTPEVHAAGAMNASVDAAATSARARDRSIFIYGSRQAEKTAGENGVAMQAMV
jgi:hypothetical protein